MASKLQTMAQNAENAAIVLAALANPKRLMILCHLINCDQSAGELAKLVDLSHSALSQHLSKLKTLNIISSARSGKEIIYHIADPKIKEILNTMYRLYCK